MAHWLNFQPSCKSLPHSRLCACFKINAAKSSRIYAAHKPLQCVSPEWEHIYIYICRSRAELYNPLPLVLHLQEAWTRVIPRRSAAVDALVSRVLLFSHAKQLSAHCAVPQRASPRKREEVIGAIDTVPGACKKAQKYHRAANRDQRSRLITARERARLPRQQFGSSPFARFCRYLIPNQPSAPVQPRPPRTRWPRSFNLDDSKVSLTFILVQIYSSDNRDSWSPKRIEIGSYILAFFNILIYCRYLAWYLAYLGSLSTSSVFSKSYFLLVHKGRKNSSAFGLYTHRITLFLTINT